MEYLIGLLIGVVFFIALIGGVLIGMRFNNVTKHKPPDVDEDEKRNMKQLNEDFKKLMSYNETVARQPKKVT